MIIDPDIAETRETQRVFGKDKKATTYRVIADPSNSGYSLLAVRESPSPTAAIVKYAKDDEELLVSNKPPRIQVHDKGAAYTKVTGGWVRTDFVTVLEE